MRQYLILNVIILYLLFSLQTLANDNIRVARMFSDEELRNSTYTAFCMDSFGFMWIGTDNGLIRFDGNHYQVYRHMEGDPESISDNRILGLLRDKNNRMWIATANGLNLYDLAKDSFRRIEVPDFGMKGYIISFAVSGSGKLIFVVSGVGIYEVKEDNVNMTVRRLVVDDSLKDINCIMSHRNGCIYAGTGKGKVYELTNGNHWKKIAEMDSPVCDITQEQNGSLIINSFTGIFRYNFKSKELTRIQLGSDIKVNNLSASIDGRVYLATYGSGLWEICSDSDVAEYCDIYCPLIAMKNSRIGAVYGSSDCSLWIGCDFWGVVYLPAGGHSFLYRRVSDIIKDFEVPLTAMGVWKGYSVIGNCAGEIAIVSKEGKLLKRAKISDRNAISSIHITQNDKAILGVIDSGVWELDLKSGELKKIVDVLDTCLSIKVCEGNDGCIYIGVYAIGLLKYNPKTGERNYLSAVSDTKSELSPYITAIKALDDNLWIGSYGGLACYNTTTGHFEEIDQAPYMACGVFDIVPENKDIILLGSSNGLIRYDRASKEMKKYTTLEGLSDNDVRSITIDGNGGKWIGTTRGINYQAPGEDSFIAYSGGNGIVENTFETLAYSEDTDMIYAAGHMGLTSFSSALITVPKFSSGLKVSDLFLKGKRVNPVDSCGYPEVINLSHDENSIAFRISTLDFRDTSNLKYLWRFAGDEDWEELPDGCDIINLSSLSPGKYTLQFKAEEAGVESPISVISIHVAHPWYLTWFAKVVYIMILLLLFYLVYTVIRKRHQERLNNKKIEFLMDMSHDMRTPLTLILGPLEAMLKERLSSSLRERIRGVYRNAHRILNIVNQLLDLNRINKGIKGLECRMTKLPDFIAEIVEMFQPEARDKCIKLSFSYEDNWNDVWIDRTIIDRIIVNLISNALKYTPEDGKVDVSLRKTNYDQRESAEICVRDNGIGFSFDSHTDVSRRYNRLENGVLFADDGYGLGFDICRRYVKLHHGEIYAEKRNDVVSGSVFTVIIPIGKCNYSPHELIFEDKMSDGEEMIEISPERETDLRKIDKKNDTLIGCKMLIVEDDDTLRASLEQSFNNIYDVQTASDGQEGYKYAQALNPDVIITDVNMLDADGLKLLELLKSNTATRHIPVIILSSKYELSDRIAGLQHGAEAFIGKPFDMNELSSIVRNLIDGRKKFERKVLEEEVCVCSTIIPNVKGNDESLMERINKILEERIDEEDMNVDALAEAVGVSRTHLYRRMKERLGINPSDYIRKIRLQKACELLRNDDLDITQIAYALGFSSQSQFSTTFKRFMGYTPTDYRTKHKKDTD